MDKFYREVSVSERLPKESGFYTTNCGRTHFLSGCGRWAACEPQWWMEKITLDHIQDKRELTATFLVNSIRLLDEQGARHLVKELCERFHLKGGKDE